MPETHGRPDPEDGLREEFREHLDLRSADLMRQGLSEPEARRRARLEFGAVESYKEACRDERRTRTTRVLVLLDQLSREIRFATRRLGATPVFTVFAALSLALGLGVTTAAYSTIESLFWTASSIDDPGRLAVVTRTERGAGSYWRQAMSRLDFDDVRSQVRSLPALAASSLTVGTLNDGTRTSAFTVQAVTGNYFETVRLPLRFGRGIEAADDRSGADAVVVLSYNFWHSKLGSDPGIVGRTVRIAGHPFTVVGVASERIQSVRDTFGGFGLVDGDGWIPLAGKRVVTGFVAADRDVGELTVVARVPAQTTLQAVATELAGVGAALDRSAPIVRDTSAGVRAVPRSWSATTAAVIAREPAAVAGHVAGAAVLLVGLVLVVACTNIANLTLGRGASRVHEFTVRRALGASRGRLIREQCMESVVLAVLGGFGAFLVATALCRYLTMDVPTGVNFQMIALQPRLSVAALLTAGGALIVSLVVFGVVPALQLTRASLRERLAGAAGGASPTRWKGRRHLIAWQVAISTAFMLMAFASMRAVTAEARHDPGFDLPHLAIGVVSLRPLHGDPIRARRVIEALDTAARAQPGFESAALTAGLAMGTSGMARQAATVWPLEQPSGKQVALAVRATPGIFRTLGVPILRGRGFDARDRAGTNSVMVVSEHVARQAFGATEAVGRQMQYVDADGSPTTMDVIGVARDTDTMDLFDRRFGSVYVPLAQHDAQTAIIVGRTAGDPEPMAPTFAGIVRQADPDLALQFASTGVMAMAPGYVVLGGVATLSGWLSILAVTLAMLGLYGVLSHIVARRTREIGLRLALGAEASEVRRMIVGEGLRPVVWGLGVGLLVGTGARLVLRAVYEGRNIATFDPFAFTFAAVTLLTAGLVACYLPARRASGVDPAIVLRVE